MHIICVFFQQFWVELIQKKMEIPSNSLNKKFQIYGFDSSVCKNIEPSEFSLCEFGQIADEVKQWLFSYWRKG